MKKSAYILFIIIASATISFAQKFTAQASKTKVAVGETFQISFTINANGSNFKAPSLNGFDVYSGPNQSTNMSFVNGVMSQSVSMSYVVAAKKEGKITIGPASVNVGGNTIQSNSLTIEVVKGSANAQNNQSPQNSSSDNGENAGNNLFVKTIVSKSKAYQGEAITVTHKIYTRYQLRGFQDIKFPDYTGFWSQDVPGNQQVQVTQENFDGVNYQVAVMKQTFLFAQRSGKLTIEPMTVECVVRQQSNKRPRDIFEQFFGGGGYEDAVYSVKSKPVTIEIVPLPEANKPADFSGAVGDYSMKVQVSKEKIKANEGINLIVNISGSGNIKLVEPLKINFPEDFEVYDPKTTDKVSVSANGVSGSKTFDYLFIPRHEGTYKLNNINFSYFDTDKKEYVTLPSPEFTIEVEKGDESATTATVYNPSKEDVKILGNDIRYIKTNNVILKPKDDYFFSSPLFYTGLISPFIAFVGFIFIRRKNIKENSDAVAVKSRKATKMAKKRLSIAEQHLKTKNKELFYIEIFKALYGYISDKLNIPVADLSKEHISETLKNKNVSEATIQQLISTIDNCEYARYAPNAVSGDLNSIYQSTITLITKIEDEVRKA